MGYNSVVRSVCGAIRAALVALNESMLRLSLGGRLAMVACTVAIPVIASVSVGKRLVEVRRAEVMQLMEERARVFRAEQEALSRRIGPWTIESLKPEVQGAVASIWALQPMPDSGTSPVMRVTCTNNGSGKLSLSLTIDLGVSAPERVLIGYDDRMPSPFWVEELEGGTEFLVSPFTARAGIVTEITQRELMIVDIHRSWDQRSYRDRVEFPVGMGYQVISRIFTECGFDADAFLSEVKRYL